MTLTEIIEIAVFWLTLLTCLVSAVMIIRRRRHGGYEEALRGEEEGEMGFEQITGPQRIVYGAGLPLPYWIVWMFFGLVGCAAALIVLDLVARHPWLAGVVLVIVTLALWAALREFARVRALKFEQKLIQAIDLMIGSLRVGESPNRALETVAANAEKPVRREMRMLVKRLKLGVKLPRALRPMVRNFDSEGLRLFASTLAAKSVTGGDMIPVLERVNRVLRDRVRHRLRVKSLLAGPNLASIIAGILPYLVLVFFVFWKKDWFDRLFSNQAGLMLFVGAVCLQILGYVWLFRMRRIEM